MPWSISQLYNKYVGKRGLCTFEPYRNSRRFERIACSVFVEILDVRTHFGRNTLLVEPVAGVGTQWVPQSWVRVLEKDHQKGGPSYVRLVLAKTKDDARPSDATPKSFVSGLPAPQ